MHQEQTELAHSVCIVIPLLNEEASLPMLGDRLRLLEQRIGARYALSFLFVNDGSTDRTAELLPTVVPPGAAYTICSHETNRGVGAAFRTAFARAAADVVCTIDSDCSYGPELLGQMIDEIACGRSDVNVASPYHPLGGAEGVQRWRLLLSANCSLLYRHLSPLRLYTYTSIFRAYRGSVVREMQFRRDDFISAVEILLSASARGYRVSETPMVLHARSAGVSKMRIAKTIAGHMRLLGACLLSRDGYPSFCAVSSQAEAGAHGRPRGARQSWSSRTRAALDAGAAQVSTTLDVESKGVLPQ